MHMQQERHIMKESQDGSAVRIGQGVRQYVYAYVHVQAQGVASYFEGRVP